MKSPKVSVVIPVYDGEKTLRKCLDSVLNQTYKNYEVIVVDNNSTDRTAEILEEFQKKSRIPFTVGFEPFRRRGAARNAGLKEAKGEIIAMTDSDCIVPGNWIEELIKPILNGKENIVQGNESDLIGNYWTRMQQKFNHQFFMNHLKGDYINHLDTKNFAIRREILLNAGMFNKNIGNNEDFEFKIRINKNGYKLFFKPECKVKHFHKDSFSRLFSRRIDQGYWIAKIYRLHKDYFRERNEKTVSAVGVFNFITFFPWLLLFLLQRGFQDFFFELVTGIAWRIGIAKEMLKIK